MKPPIAGMAAAVFDCDGVLVDSESLHARMWIEALAPLGLHLDERWFDPWIGLSEGEMAGHLRDSMGVDLPKEEIVDRKRRTYRAAVEAGRLRAFPGIGEGLERLRRRGIALAVASNGFADVVRLSLRCCGLDPWFSQVVGVDEVANGKPAPDIYIEATRRLGTPPGDCVVVEDSPAGIQAARAAGCRVLAVANTHRREALKGADTVYDNTVEALKAIGE
jgi:HAD superfamily hydrolase (TIGR01509 family)